MTMIYKLLRALSLVLSLSFLWMVTGFAQEPSLFVVEGVEVDVTASNALQARDQAFDEAQKKAFEALSERLLADDEIQNFKAPDLSTISTLIKDYEITNEKLSSVRYIGTYTFRFDENGIRNLFTGSGQRFTDVQSRPLLILPFYQKDASMTLWSPDNIWMQAWDKSENTGTLVPLIVPIGDLEDVRDVRDNQALNYDENKLQSMLARYGAGEAVLLIATPDAHLSMVESQNQPATGALSIGIYRTDRNGPEYTGRIAVSAQPDQTLSELMDVAVLRVQGLLKKDWKERTMVAADEIGSLEAVVPIRSLSEWAAIQRQLQLASGINDVMVKSLSPHEARIQIAYQGNPQRLGLALEQVDLSLKKSAPDPSFGGGLFLPSSYILTRSDRSPPGSFENGRSSSTYMRQF